MMKPLIARGLSPVLAVLAGAALACTFASSATAAKSKGTAPLAITGAITHVRGISAELDGTVVPGTQTTSYYFQYGPTTSYGSQTAPQALPPGATRIKVAQSVTGLLLGSHYRLVATSLAGTSTGKDKSYTTKSIKDRFTVVKPTTPNVFGGALTITGTLQGSGNANRMIVLQASPFPFLEPFANFGIPIATNGAGAFVFHVPALTSSTQFRVATLDPRPLFSPLLTEQVGVRVTLRVRTSKRKGLVRLYGTVTPAEVGARVAFQLSKAVRPGGKSERSTKFSTQFSTIAKRATRTTSRFSMIVEVHRGGRYRAYVEIKKGALVAGSSPSLILAAAPGQSKKKH